MSDRKALIAAIREAPDDDAPRLIFADWLEERGDDASVARAAFIRTQIERARLPAQDLRQIELEARELKLLKSFSVAWQGSHFLFKKSRFRRGFIEYVHVNLQHFLHHRRQLFDLEPVRDVSLTGWMRATDDLVRRVADCEEWRNVETLRIHHQGPHKSPRSNLVTLIESPYLTRLKSLRVPMLAINADARRRFENAPVLTQLSELSLPHLDTYPDNPGRWLSDGLPKRLWNRLRSLQLIDDMMRPDVLAQLTESPFWKQLRSLTVNLPVHQTAEIMAILRDRLPPALENLRLIANHSPVQLGDGNSFYARLAKTPLRQLEIKWAPIGSTALQGLLDASSSCELRELSLRECDFSDEHMGVLAESPGTRQLESLSVSQYRGVTAASAPSFFQSENLQGLAGLNLAISAYCIWSDGISALARSTHWKNLRRLELTGGGLNHETLRKLLASPFANQLVRLTVECDDVGGPIERASLFERIHRLPHLARLHVTVNEIDDELRMQSNRLKRQGWTTIQCHNSATDYYVDTSELPPLDDDLESSDQVP